VIELNKLNTNDLATIARLPARQPEKRSQLTGFECFCETNNLHQAPTGTDSENTKSNELVIPPSRRVSQLQWCDSPQLAQDSAVIKAVDSVGEITVWFV
jgi:hypothetical protein